MNFVGLIDFRLWSFRQINYVILELFNVIIFSETKKLHNL